MTNGCFTHVTSPWMVSKLLQIMTIIVLKMALPLNEILWYICYLNLQEFNMSTPDDEFMLEDEEENSGSCHLQPPYSSLSSAMVTSPTTDTLDSVVLEASPFDDLGKVIQFWERITVISLLFTSSRIVFF